jgi:hypothetical protein
MRAAALAALLPERLDCYVHGGEGWQSAAP